MLLYAALRNVWRAIKKPPNNKTDHSVWKTKSTEIIYGSCFSICSICRLNVSQLPPCSLETFWLVVRLFWGKYRDSRRFSRDYTVENFRRIMIHWPHILHSLYHLLKLWLEIPLFYKDFVQPLIKIYIHTVQDFFTNLVK